MKGSFKTVLIAIAVIFGMMLMTKGCQKPETTFDNSMQAANTKPIELISEDETRYICDFVREAGVTDPETGNVEYNYNNVTLTWLNEADSVIGNVMVNDTLTLTYEQVAKSDFPKEMLLSTKQDAAQKLREAIESARDYQMFAKHLAPNDAPEVTLKNDVLEVKFSNKGGHISNATLLKYFTYFPKNGNENEIDTAQVQVIRPEKSYYEFTLRTTGQREISTGSLYFTPRQVNDSVVEMTVDLPNGAKWGYRYTLRQGESYIVGMEIIQENMDAIIPPSMNTSSLHWHQLMARQERGRTFEERNSGIYYKYVSDSPDGLAGPKDGREQLNHNVSWLAYKNQFFSTVMIPRVPFDGGVVAQAVQKGENAVNYLKDMDAYMSIPYNNASNVPVAIDIFIGPNLYPLLSDLDKQLSAEDLSLTRLVPLGWNWLRWINTVIVIPIFSFLSEYISSYGVIILLLTIFIKLILFPFTYKSYRSQAKMRVLAPEIKEINDKYPGKENAMVRQQKTMELYKRAGASPMSGCLPLLLQMPILIAMFSFFPSCIELRGESFLWAHNLAAPDYICTLPFSIPLYGNKVSLFCLLMTITNVAYTYINMKSQPSTSSMPGIKWMMYLMPLMFLFFFNDYAAALSYYYFLSLLITIIQTWAFRRCINEQKLRKQMMENAAKPRKKSGFMARLEEAQRRQQAILREQQQKGKKK